MEEDDPILGPAVGSSNTAHGRYRHHVAHPSRLSRYAIWFVLILLLLINLTNGICNIPLNRLLERRLCRAYYDTDHDVDEKLCKVDSVQQTLAWIMGGFETLWIVGGQCEANTPT